MATSRQLFNIVDLLLTFGADPNISEYEHSGLICPLHMAAENNSYDITKLLLDWKADPNVQTKTGATPLHIAAKAGFSEIVELLVTYGADVNRRDTYGFTASFWAFENNHEKVLEILPPPSAISVKELCEFREFVDRAHGHNMTDMRRKKKGMKGMKKR